MKSTDRMPFIQPIGPDGKPITFVPYDFSNWESDRLKYYLKRIEEMKMSKEKYDIAKKVVEQYEAAEKTNKIEINTKTDEWFKDNPLKKDWFGSYGIDAADAIAQSYYMQTVPDSHYFSELEQIIESLRYLKSGYIVAPVPKGDGIHINWPPISIDHIRKGIDNTIANGYKMILKSQLEEQEITNEEVRQLKEWLDDLNVPKKQMGKDGQEYSIIGRILELISMVQSDFQNIYSSGIFVESCKELSIE